MLFLPKVIPNPYRRRLCAPAEPYTGTGEGIGDAEKIIDELGVRPEFEKIRGDLSELREAALNTLNALRGRENIHMRVDGYRVVTITFGPANDQHLISLSFFRR